MGKENGLQKKKKEQLASTWKKNKKIRNFEGIMGREEVVLRRVSVGVHYIDEQLG